MKTVKYQAILQLSSRAAGSAIAFVGIACSLVNTQRDA
jgi:hypothetical protein